MLQYVYSVGIRMDYVIVQVSRKCPGGSLL